jgi:hypothetical protein
MPTRPLHLVIDAVEPARLARFWAAALDWAVPAGQSGEVAVWPWQVLADPDGSEFCVLSARGSPG